MEPPGPPGAPAEAPEAVPPAASAGTDELPAASWPDEAVESAILAEARERGEPPPVRAPGAEAAEEVADPKALPPLNDLVNRIPAEVREVLEDLYRARFVAVKRVPLRALKA